MADATQTARQRDAQGIEKFLVLPVVVLIMAQMGTSGDNGALGIANQALVQQLGATGPDIQLANMVYSLMAGALMVAGGMLGTIKGFVKTFRTGALMCGIGEFIMAFAPNMAVFIWGGRTLVGLGASFMIPAVLGLVPLIYQGKNRALAFGCIGAASGLASLLPLLLGIVMQLAGMRVTFSVMGIYFLIVLALSFKLPKVVVPGTDMKFDGVGTGLAALGLFLFLFGMSRISVWGVVAPLAGCPFTFFGISPALPIMVMGIIVLVVLFRVEKKVEAKNGSALLPQSFFKSKQVIAGLVASAITFFFMGVQTILLAPYLQLVGGWSPILMGAVSLVSGIPIFLFAMLIPKFAPHANPRHVLQLGYAVMAGSFVLMYFAVGHDGINLPLMVLAFFCAGTGAGIMSAHQNNVVALALDERDAAQSGGIQSTMRNVGQAIGVALLGSILLFGITNGVNSRAASDQKISQEVAQQISNKSISLMSDKEFEENIKDIQMTDDERAELVEINNEARLGASHISFVIAGIIVLAAIITTPWITKTGVEKKEEETQQA